MRIWAIWVTVSLVAGCQAKETRTVSQECLTTVPPPVSLAAAKTEIGSDNTYPEEAPVRAVSVPAFTIDAVEVTNAQFAEFVAETGYVTTAEKTQPGFEAPGAAVFMPPTATHPSWWRFVEGADWRRPEGPDSPIEGRGRDPVVQVSYADAKAYAAWAGRRLPTEAEWEYAAQAGSDTLYVWGDERAPDDREYSNTWQGVFPVHNTLADGYALRAPVGCFPANDFGLYDMIGNVWEWTDTIYQNGEGEPVYTIKGGSFLCAENYCRRYRASARQPQEAGLPTNHIGFRTVADE